VKKHNVVSSDQVRYNRAYFVIFGLMHACKIEINVGELGHRISCTCKALVELVREGFLPAAMVLAGRHEGPGRGR